MDVELAGLAKLVAQGDYLAAKRALAHIERLAVDPSLAKDVEAGRRLALLQAKVKRIRSEAFDDVTRRLRAVAARLEDVKGDPVQLDEWIQTREPMDEAWKSIQGIFDGLRETRRRVCLSCRGTGCVAWGSTTDRCHGCSMSSIPGTLGL